jgi:hypothetical protein
LFFKSNSRKTFGTILLRLRRDRNFYREILLISPTSFLSPKFISRPRFNQVAVKYDNICAIAYPESLDKDFISTITSLSTNKSNLYPLRIFPKFDLKLIRLVLIVKPKIHYCSIA